ncbi:MAG: response regulator [Gammaproteobacteria bacterium]|nr:response regulator [Gammaproteobacteria bacterium]
MKTILLVEDDEKISLAMTARLKASGYAVVTAQDAPSALMKARQTTPDVVLLDIGLPGGDGLEVAKNLQEKVFDHHVPIIFITASKQEGLKAEAKKLRASGFIEKPFKASQLLPAIDEALLSASSF